MKTLIILLGCLTANAVTAADEHFEARLAAVSIPQQADTLAANETPANNALATEPDIMCVALLEALSARRISDPFGVRPTPNATLREHSRSAFRTSRLINDVVTLSASAAEASKGLRQKPLNQCSADP